MTDEEIKEISFSELKELIMSGEGVTTEGLMFLGCGGSLNEWIIGVSEELHNAGVTTTKDPNKLWGKIYKTTTTGQRIDLILMFNKNFAKLFSAKLAIWRIQWGGVSWVSDYLNNYASHHEESVSVITEREVL